MSKKRLKELRFDSKTVDEVSTLYFYICVFTGYGSGEDRLGGLALHPRCRMTHGFGTHHRANRPKRPTNQFRFEKP
jgi:hypothetical protein